MKGRILELRAALRTIRFDFEKCLIRAGVSLFFPRKGPFPSISSFTILAKYDLSTNSPSNCDNL